MNNWFYMDRLTFERLLIDELGRNLTQKLFEVDFDTPVSFLIGETADQILTKIQETFSRSICSKMICNDRCIFCSQNPSTYAKLTWFIQRLLIMSPLKKPFIKQPSINQNNSYTQIRQCSANIHINKNNTTDFIHSERECFIVIILILIMIIISLLLL
jgi:hypothetical protein